MLHHPKHNNQRTVIPTKLEETSQLDIIAVRDDQLKQIVGGKEMTKKDWAIAAAMGIPTLGIGTIAYIKTKNAQRG